MLEYVFPSSCKEMIPWTHVMNRNIWMQNLRFPEKQQRSFYYTFLLKYCSPYNPKVHNNKKIRPLFFFYTSRKWQNSIYWLNPLGFSYIFSDWTPPFVEWQKSSASARKLAILMLQKNSKPVVTNHLIIRITSLPSCHKKRLDNS